MDVQIKLYRNKWISGNGIHSIGWASTPDTYYPDKAFHQFIESQIDPNTFGADDAYQLANTLNGSYALVITTHQSVFLIADRTRSYPLIYLKNKGVLYITDDFLSLKADYVLKPTVDISQAETFLLSSLTFGNHTIYKEVFGIQAAEIVELSKQNETAKSKRYFRYTLNTENKQQLITKEEINKQNEIFAHVFQRMSDSAPTVHNWIVPLSGGHDSRMIINQIHKLGIKNVICFSYGEVNNRQAQLSQRVANALGYPWYFVEYTAEKWYQIRQTADFNRYFDFAFNGISNPHIQDLLAVYELNKQGVFHPDDIFVPGHTFDFITGSQCLRNIKELQSEKDVINYLRYCINQWSYKTRPKHLLKEITDMIRQTPLPYNNFTEYFYWQEWHCKFLLNSVRVYEYFGFDWRAPLWDQELVKYWQSLHVDYKLYRNFLYECEQQGLYNEPLRSIPFDFQMNPKARTIDKLLRLIPYTFIRKIKHYIRPQAIHLDDGLHHVYAHQKTILKDQATYNSCPKALQNYLKPYKNRPLCWFPDNDNNSMYALREQFKQEVFS